MHNIGLILNFHKLSVRTFATAINKARPKLNRSLISTKLTEHFNIKRRDALNIANQYKSTKEFNVDLLTANCMVCKEYSFADKMVLHCPEILVQKHLRNKIIKLNDIQYPLKITYPLLVLSDFTLNKFLQRYKQELKVYPEGRIAFIAELTKMPEEVVCKKLSKVQFLLRTDLHKLEKAYKLILSYGLQKEDINKDLWALNYNLETIEQRLAIVSQKNVGKIKLWMLRAKQEIFLKYTQRIYNNREVLGDHSLVEYLSQKLECTELQARMLLIKLPAIQNKSMKKIQEMLDFLYTKDFKPIQVYRVPKILLHSVNTVAKRLENIEKENIKLESLYPLTKSEKQYQIYYESLVRNKKS